MTMNLLRLSVRNEVESVGADRFTFSAGRFGFDVDRVMIRGV